MGEEYVRKVMVLGQVPLLGPVVLYDDIEGLLKWAKGGTGGDDTLEKDATVAYNGLASLHAKTRATNPAADDFVTALRHAYQRPGKRYRLELLWNFALSANAKNVRFRVLLYDGTYLHTIELAYLPPNNKWQYLNSAGAMADVTDGAQALTEAAWHRVMFEWDENAGKYLNFVSDGLELDLSAVEYYKAANASAVRQTVMIYVTAVAGIPPEAWFDDVLLTEI